MTDGFLPYLSSAASRPVHHFIASLLTAMLLIHASLGINESTMLEDRGMRNVGYQCKDDPKCLCANSYNDDILRKRTMVCEEKVEFIMRKEDIRIWCQGDTLVDPYNYISIPQSFMPWDGDFSVDGCHPPEQGYRALIDGTEGNRASTIQKLHIYCGNQTEFHLNPSHLNDLSSLKALTIQCPTLSNVTADLLIGISRELEEINISETLIDIFPNGFFSNFSHLDVLELSRNQLRIINGSLLEDLTELHVLDLSENRLEFIEDGAFWTTNKMTLLYINNNLLSKVPLSLCSLRNLKILWAYNNHIASIPQECFSHLVSMTDLRLQGNQLIVINYGVNSLKGISSNQSKTLEVPQEEIPKMFPNLATTSESSTSDENKFSGYKLTTLYLDNNLITSLPDNAFHDMPNLTFLEISRNKITHLHQDTLIKNGRLKILNASYNLLTSIPETLLRNNIHLGIVDFTGNRIRTLGSGFFSNLSGLCVIGLSNNRIESLPTDIFQSFTAEGKSIFKFTVPTIKLDGNLLDKIPLLTSPRLEKLSLSRNRLAHIDADMLMHVPELQVLDLSHNVIVSLGGPSESPGELGNDTRKLFGTNLKNLLHVDLSGNRLSAFPDVDLVLPNLKSLNLSGNRIPWIHREIEKIQSSLEVLDLSGNGFAFPNSSAIMISKYFTTRIKHLDLSRNMMKLPECDEKFDFVRRVWGCASVFTEFRSLEVIILSHNEIQFVPMEFQHKLPKLVKIDLSYNKISILWHHDFFFAAGVTLQESAKLSEIDIGFMRRIGDNEDSFFEFPLTHQVIVDLRHNIIETVVLPGDKVEIVPQDCEVERKFAQATVLLGGNRFKCGCNVFRLFQYSLKELRPVSVLEKQTGKRVTLPAAVDLQDLHCSEPKSVEGKAVSEPETWAHHLLPLIGFCADQLRTRHPMRNLEMEEDPEE